MSGVRVPAGPPNRLGGSITSVFCYDKAGMNNALFRTMSFPVEGSEKCACVIAGYRGKIAGYKKVIKILNNKGFSVIAYEHSPAVLTGGDPRKPLSLVEQISNDVLDKTYDMMTFRVAE